MKPSEYTIRKMKSKSNPATDSLTSLNGGMFGQITEYGFPLLGQLRTENRESPDVEFATGHCLLKPILLLGTVPYGT